MLIMRGIKQIVGIHFVWLVLLILQAQNAYSQSKSSEGMLDAAKREMELFNYGKANQYSIEAIKQAESENNVYTLLQALFIAGKSDRLNRKYTSSLNYYLQAESILTKSNNAEFTIRLNKEMGDLFLDWGVPDKALDYYANSLNNMSSDNHIYKEEILNKLAEANVQLRNYSEALKYYQQLLRRSEIKGNPDGQTKILKKIGSLYISMNQPKYALNTYLEILKIQEANNDIKSMAVTQNTVGFLYKDLGDLNKSLEYFQKALALNEQQNATETNNDEIVSNLINIGVVQQSLGDYRNSTKSFERALKIKLKTGSPAEIAVMYNYLASIKFSLGKNDDAIEHTREAIDLLEHSENKRLLTSSYKRLSEIYERLGNYTEALEYYKKYTVLNDSILFYDQLNKEKEKYKQYLAETTEKESKLGIIDKEMATLELTNEKVKAEQEKQAIELKLRKQELENISLNNEQLKKERLLQQLLLEQEKTEAQKKDQEIVLLEQKRDLQTAELEKTELEQKERQKEIELQRSQLKLQESQLELQESQLESSEARQKFLMGMVGLFLVILMMIFMGFIYQQRINKKLKAQYEMINEQKEHIEKINEDLVELNEEKNDLIGIVAHDLKSPLNQITGLLDILKMTADNENSDHVNVVNTIDKSAKRMKNMVMQILDVNAIESKSLNIELKPVNTKELLTEIIDRFEHLADKKDIKIIREIDNHLGNIFVDKNYASEVIENLLSNSVKYSPLGKTVTVKVSQSIGFVRMEFIDEGQGINSEDMKKLFGKFHKLSARPTAGEDSTGLGLSIVKRYVEALNGRVWCESEEGKGANFIVEFPTV